MIYNKIMVKQHLYLFAHLHKSAGTTLWHHFKKTASQSELLNLFPDTAGYAIYQFSPGQIAKVCKKLCLSLPAEKQQEIKLVYGHKVLWGIDQMLDSPKEPYYFTFLRDPAKRMISLYNYYRGWYERELPNRKNKKIYHNRLLIDGQYPDFKTWFENKILVTDPKKLATKPLGLSTATEYYQKLGYLQPGTLTGNKLKKFTNKFNFIGFTETFAEDSLYLYHLWGVNKFFKKRNISTKFVSLETHPELEPYLKTKLIDDYQLYEYAWNWKQSWLNQHPEFDSIVTEMRKKREAGWWHQLVFDWPANFHRFSSRIRKRLPLYGSVLDELKLFSAKVADKFAPILTKFGFEPTDKQP